MAATRSLADGISEYENEMRVRGAKEVALSFEQAQKTAAKNLQDSPIVKMGHQRNDIKSLDGPDQN